jgi:hypothetical protein
MLFAAAALIVSSIADDNVVRAVPYAGAFITEPRRMWPVCERAALDQVLTGCASSAAFAGSVAMASARNNARVITPISLNRRANPVKATSP